MGIGKGGGEEGSVGRGMGRVREGGIWTETKVH